MRVRSLPAVFVSVMSRFIAPLLLAAGIAFACGPRNRTTEAAPAARPHDPTPGAPVIASSLEVSVRENVELALHVTNTGERQLEIDFPSGKTHDFAVLDSAGHEVWRWSADRMFTQALQNKFLGAGETLTYSGRWKPAGRRGRFTAVATLASTSNPLEQRAEFTLP